MAAPTVPLINGIAYSSAVVTVTILGVPVAGITAVKYGKKQEKTNNYGLGSEPVSRGYGKAEYEASITLYLEEVFSIKKANANQSLTTIAPFEIQIAYLPPSGIAVIETLKYVEFMDDMRDFGEGDTSIPVELPLIIAGITTK